MQRQITSFKQVYRLGVRYKLTASGDMYKVIKLNPGNSVTVERIGKNLQEANYLKCNPHIVTMGSWHYSDKKQRHDRVIIYSPYIQDVITLCSPK